MPEPGTTAQTARVTQELEDLRRRHHVDLLEEASEGLSLEQIPRGTYGFTTSLGQPATPVFRKQGYQSFEVHHLPDGATHLAGFVSAAGAAQIAAGARNLEITLYPAPWGEADRLVSLPYDEIVPSRKGPARIDGNPVGVRLL